MKGIILLIYFFFLFACSPETAKVKFKNDGAIYIQVEIAGKKYPFLFDTGSTTTIFSEKLVQELGNYIQINKKDSTKNLNVASRNYQRFTYKKYNDIVLKVGKVAIKNSFVSDKEENSNIIGMNTISQMHWLFNFQDTTMILSRKPIPFKTEGFTNLALNYLANSGAMVATIRLNDSISKNLLFDTGWTFDADKKSTEKTLRTTDLVFETTIGDPNNVVDELGNIGGLNYEMIFRNGKKAMIFPTLKLDDMQMDYVTAMFTQHPFFEKQEQASLHGSIPYGFVANRFSYMGINPEEKKVSLYSNGSEHLEYTRCVKSIYKKQTKEFYEKHGLPYPPESK